MASHSKRTLLTACGLATGMLALGPVRVLAAPPQSSPPSPPQVVTLLLGDALDAQGRQKPIKSTRRKLFDYLEQELNIVFDIKRYPWPRAERNALAGAGLIFGLPKSPARLRTLRYSEIAGSNSLWLVTRSDATFPMNSPTAKRLATL